MAVWQDSLRKPSLRHALLCLALLYISLKSLTGRTTDSLAGSAVVREVHDNQLGVSISTLTNLTKRADDYACSKDKPCGNGACCGGSGFCGYGPKYCGKDCVSDCTAVAECGQFAKNPGAKCPLNTCCSEFGFVS
jgi:chitinase